MDKSKILDIVFYDKSYVDDIKLLEDKDYKENDKTFWGICEKLLKDLPEEDKKKINSDIFFALGGMEAATRNLYFNEGFKLGLIIGAQNFLE